MTRRNWIAAPLLLAGWLACAAAASAADLFPTDSAGSSKEPIEIVADRLLGAARTGGTALAAANAADELLVARFLQGEIPCTQIAMGIERVLGRHTPQPASVEAVLEADRSARELAAHG